MKTSEQWAAPGLMDFLKSARERTLDRHRSASDPIAYLYSGTAYALWREAGRRTRENSAGLVLDAGSGRGAWRQVIESTGARREAADIVARQGEDLAWVADLTCMPGVPSARFDAVICHQVLEHVRRPVAALGELHRVLKPGGRLVLSAPHLSRLHDLPHDYFRYTPAGIRILLEEAGFEIVELATYGGVITFLHHQCSAIVLGLAASLGPLYYLFAVVNAPFSVLASLLDRVLDRAHLMPNGVVVVAQKNG